MIDPDINIYLLIFLVGSLPTVIWRFLGVYFAVKISEDSEVFVWVRSVATALIAALVMRIVIAPTGLLAQTALSSRVLALGAAVVIFAVMRPRISYSLVASLGTLYVLEMTGIRLF
jgi:branched-subunit amino acid transport protein